MSGGLEPAEKTVKSDAHIYVIKFEMKVATIIRNRKRHQSLQPRIWRCGKNSMKRELGCQGRSWCLSLCTFGCSFVSHG